MVDKGRNWPILKGSIKGFPHRCSATLPHYLCLGKSGHVLCIYSTSLDIIVHPGYSIIISTSKMNTYWQRYYHNFNSLINKCILRNEDSRWLHNCRTTGSHLRCHLVYHWPPMWAKKWIQGWKLTPACWPVAGTFYVGAVEWATTISYYFNTVYVISFGKQMTEFGSRQAGRQKC